MAKNKLTREGLTKYQEELDYLKSVKRKEISQKIKEAREQGDLSENAEYDAAKDAQGKLEARIALLKDKVANARIIDATKLSTEKIQIMSKVRLLNHKLKKEVTYTIVSESEANFMEGKISVATPIAKALLNHKVGDIVEVRVPAGVQQLEVLDISL
jgi:transcription elongation factor GreA